MASNLTKAGFWAVLSLLACSQALANEANKFKPSILVILCDDLGYGDVRALNKGSKIATPQIDRLAAEGVSFTDAHSSSSVCSPTRYSLLTGRYNWRSRLQKGVLGGMSPRLIEPNQTTLATMLKQQGYNTACVGKWHLGVDWQLNEDADFKDDIEQGKDGWKVDFTKPFTNGPTSVGFDYYFGISASLDMVPYTFLENDRVVVQPTLDVDFPMMLGRNPDRTTRRGPAAEGFDANQVLPRLTEKTVELIDGWAAEAKADKPFFIYLPLASPHTPIAPTQEWLGKSGLNPYADFVMQTDAAIGEILAALDRNQLTENTLVILTSDNGCSPQADFEELRKFDHNPNFIFRGNKADIFEGGHRVPYIARWPKVLKSGQQCQALVGLQDTMATCAQALGLEVGDDVAVDSYSWLAHVNDDFVNARFPKRESLVHHSINGSFAIRRENWKLCFCPDSGGWSSPRPNSKGVAELPPQQLFDLKADIGEKTNVTADQPQIVSQLTNELATLINNGRSTPGPKQSNTVPVQWTPPNKNNN